MFVSLGPRYTEQQAREAVAGSHCYTEALRRLGMRPAGGNFKTLRHYVEVVWTIPTDHFDPYAARVAALRRGGMRPLSEVLVEGSTYSRGQLKRRLYAEGIKSRTCEICGQGEIWRGNKMSLILDHANGVADDNRLENLRIVCPNCAATLPTHCGRNVPREPRECVLCGEAFEPRALNQRYCSRSCGSRDPGRPGPRPRARRVARPPCDELLADVRRLGYCAVARRYGLSDNAIRKWLRAEGIEPPRRTWPNRRRSGYSTGTSTKPSVTDASPASDTAISSSEQPQSHARASSSSSEPVGLGLLGAVLVGADELGAEHGRIVSGCPDAMGAPLAAAQG
ncbi:MAG: hypothetical protein QOD53_1267 [Thermoleophilaceae bacterium]|jgi:hypothetical protein|nr:hypothetical protein [Thermoleophilaceae bacterium]